MSKGKQHKAGASEGARRATGEASASSALVGTGRWSARRKVSVVIELLKGKSLESLSPNSLRTTPDGIHRWKRDAVTQLPHSGERRGT